MGFYARRGVESGGGVLVLVVVMRDEMMIRDTETRYGDEREIRYTNLRPSSVLLKNSTAIPKSRPWNDVVHIIIY